jgi:hypothetical protein
MSTKAIASRALILAVVGGWAAHAAAQTPAVPGQPPEQLPPPATPAPQSPISSVIPPPSQAPAIQAGLPAGSVPDPWITYDRPGCCGPMGGNGPIGWEYYLRNGVNIPTGNNILQNSLNPGWFTEIGARSLFFNAANTAAWTADVGVGYQYNNAGGPDHVFNVLFPFNVQNFAVFPPTTTLTFAPVPVTIRDYQRAFVAVAGGFEVYPGQPAYCPGTHFRVGADVGGRYGASRLELNDLGNPNIVGYRRLYDVYGAVTLSVHADVEIPITACTWFVAGFRAEWDYNWTDILHDAAPHQSANLADINLLLTAGFRF